MQVSGQDAGRWAASSILGSTGRRFGLALAAIGALWAGVLWAALTPEMAAVAPTSSAEDTAEPHPPQAETPAPVPRRVGLRALVVSGEPAGLNGSFDRFGHERMPMVLASNQRGDTAFYATIRRSEGEEGLFLAKADRELVRVAVAGDPVPDQAGQLIAGFGERPSMVMNNAGDIAFSATLAGGRGAASVFLASEGRVKTIASAGNKAPVILGGIGVFADFDAPSLNGRGDVAFLAWIRHGRETIEAIYVARKVGAVHQLTKLIAVGEPAPGGGFFTGFGAPVVNDAGVVAFPAVVKLGPALGGIFLAAADGPPRLLIGTGDPAPTGGMFTRFSERIGFDDSGRVAFGAFTSEKNANFGIFVADGGERRTIAATGFAAPGGGVYSAFGAWPAMTHDGRVGFTAAIDNAPVSSGVFLANADGSVTRVLSPGDPLMDGGKLISLGLYPSISVASDGSVSLLGIVERGGDQFDAVLRHGLAPVKPR